MENDSTFTHNKAETTIFLLLQIELKQYWHKSREYTVIQNQETKNGYKNSNFPIV